MTLDALIDKARRQFDAHFARQQEEQLLTMIACGIDEDFALDFLEQRAEQYAAWRPQALADVRQMLLTHDSPS